MTPRPETRSRPAMPRSEAKALAVPSSKSRPRDANVSFFLHPGDLMARVGDVQIVTILGSCIAVCIGDCAKHIGGMNHFQMPGDTANKKDSLRFGPSATRALLDQVLKLGAKRQRLEAKVFGGASLLHDGTRQERGLGSENAKAALQTLAALRIPVVASDLGGRRARKLIYRIEDGSVWVRPI